jgi:hypothetical protein
MRVAHVMLLPAGMLVTLAGAAPASAADPGSSPVRAKAVTVVSVGVCLDLDLLSALNVRIEIGACPGHHEPPTPPPTPAPPRPTHRPSSPKPAPPRPSRAAPPPGVIKPVRPAVARPSPSTTPTATPTYQPRRPRAHVLRRRQNPLGSVMVLVVLSTVIAAGAGIAFAAIR